ncbi:MAG: hypothetical protein FJW20_04715 [Acidimicrobiia bacterium]|nr:hypothetical protein [Acidimicrobiia bacterium]
MLRRKCATVLLASISIASLSAADKKSDAFRPPAADTFPNRQKQAGVVIAADPYVASDQLKPAFDKLNPNDYGVLPVLVLIQNGSDKTIDLTQISVVYVDANRRNIDSTPAAEVQYLNAPERPKPNVSGIPKFGKKKNPLAAFEIESRAFVAKMLPQGESAHGFFYFQSDHRAGAMLYITGLRDASTKKELFYFEVPLPERPIR